jgi:FlaA1/EpsC-like NDP-sugar epimerase
MVQTLLKLRQLWGQLVFYKWIRWAMVIFLSVIIIKAAYLSSALVLGRGYWNQFGLEGLSFGILIVSQFVFIHIFKINRGLWRYSSVTDLVLIIKAASSSLVLNALAAFGFNDWGQALRFLVVDHTFFIMAFGGLRLALRSYYHFEPKAKDFKNVLIIGAGDGGDLACRHFNRNKNKYSIVGILDDDAKKISHHIHGNKVLGTTDDLAKMIQIYHVDEVVVAIPSATPKFIRDIAQVSFENKVAVRVMPPISEMDSDGAQFEIRALRLEDLLFRDKVSVDLEFIRHEYAGKRILVTGAAGSIGEEIVRQVAGLGPEAVYLLDQAESPLYFLFRECAARFPHVRFVPLLCDITDKLQLEKIFSSIKPHVVLHAAAYKHVPILEENIYQALTVNVEGTWLLAELSHLHGVERFVFISTDKAVNPTNILGVSKRMAEFVCKAHQEGSKTKFIAVRFGNVIGSQGSVIPLFKKQIEQGGPVTITHPEIRRYFMMIPEAVQLVLFAGVLGEGGEVFVLDMGKQIRILDLAMNMVRLCGFEPNKDIKIEYCGLRPGEKLFEELYDETEEVQKTKHPKVNVALSPAIDRNFVLEKISACLTLVKKNSAKENLVRSLKEIVKTYRIDSLAS